MAYPCDDIKKGNPGILKKNIKKKMETDGRVAECEGCKGKGCKSSFSVNLMHGKSPRHAIAGH